MLYIRKKSNPLILKSWGNVSSGGLGEYDTDLYEEVLADNLPDGWQPEQAPKSLDMQLQNVYKSMPIATRAVSATDVKIAQIMIQLGDIEGAKEYLEASELEPEVKNSFLTLFNGQEQI